MEIPDSLQLGPLREQLRAIHEQNLSKMEECRLCLDQASRHIQHLKAYLLEAEPLAQEEAMNLQREFLPLVYAELLFYLQRYQMELRLCYSTREERSEALKREQQHSRTLLQPHRELLSYYRSGARFLDENYFRPLDNAREWPAPAPEAGEPASWTMDTVLSTPTGFRLAKAIALERFSLLLAESEPDPMLVLDDPGLSYERTQLTWTASKTDLVELLYAFHSSGVLNHAALELHRLAEGFESMFQVKLGNYSRVFQQIRIRKKNRTSFLDHLRVHLLRHMDELED